MDTLNPKTVSVFQSIFYNRVRREYYISQKVSATPNETTVVARLDDNGKFLDQMTLTGAGHGTGVVVENVGSKNQVYIWVPWNSQNNDYYRFPYAKGTFTFSQVAGKTKIPKFTTGYLTYHADWEADVMLDRRNNADKTITMRKRKISEVVKGIDKVYATLTTEAVTTAQGWATINDSVYVLQGAANGEYNTPPDPSLLDTYNWSTGTRVDRVNIQDLGKENGGWQQDTHEPEGLSVYRDPTTKKASLILGVTTGVVTNSSKHKYFIYRYSNIGNAP